MSISKSWGHLFLLGAIGLGAATAACSSSGGSGDPPDVSGGNVGTSSCFLAFTTQFQGFRSWTSNHFESSSDIGMSTHVTGPRTEYVNQLPPAGATEFPIGTIIVKEIESTDPSTHHIFAMVKRGCNFNASGASGWEWFELTDNDNALAILWRGVGPPSGEKYGGDATGGCNTCHADACKSNDSVCSPSASLQLAK